MFITPMYIYMLTLRSGQGLIIYDSVFFIFVVFLCGLNDCIIVIFYGYA